MTYIQYSIIYSNLNIDIINRIYTLTKTYFCAILTIEVLFILYIEGRLQDMVYNEAAYREVFPEVKIEKITEPVESMIKDDLEDIKPEVKKVEEELETDPPAPAPEKEGQDDTGSSDPTN